MVVDTMTRAFAVGSIAMMWTYFTLKLDKICGKIIFPFPEKEERYEEEEKEEEDKYEEEEEDEEE